MTDSLPPPDPRPDGLEPDPPSPHAAGVIAIGTGCVAAALYVASLLPTVGFIDAPRYAAFVARMHLGVASIEHPLFVLLATPFTWLGIGDIAYRVNLASAAFGAMAVGVLAALLFRTTASHYAAWIGALAYATSYDHWWLSTETEVYTLQVLLLFGMLFLLIGRPMGRSPAPGRAAALLGLAVVNHQAALLWAFPALLYTASVVPREDRARALGRGCLGFFVGVAPYIALVGLRAHTDGWDVTWAAMTGGEFQSSFLAPIGFAGYARVVAFLVVITGYQFYPIHTAAWIGGFAHLHRADPRRSFLLIGIAALNAATVVLYDVPDRIYFYLPTFAILAIFLGEGLAAVDLGSRGWPNRRGRWFVLALLTLPVGGKIVHYQLADDFIGTVMGGEERVFDAIRERASGRFPILVPHIPGRNDLSYYTNPDKSDVIAARHYEAVLDAMPVDALLLDDWYHGYAIMADYYQGTLGLRPDVEVLRWFERWGGTPEERDEIATRVISEARNGRPVFLATSEYPSSTLIARLAAADCRCDSFGELEALRRVDCVAEGPDLR